MGSAPVPPRWRKGTSIRRSSLCAARSPYRKEEMDTSIVSILRAKRIQWKTTTAVRGRALIARTCTAVSRLVRPTSSSPMGTECPGPQPSGTSRVSHQPHKCPPARAANAAGLASRREFLAVLSAAHILLLVSSLHRCVSMLMSRKRRKRTFYSNIINCADKTSRVISSARSPISTIFAGSSAAELAI